MEYDFTYSLKYPVKNSTAVVSSSLRSSQAGSSYIRTSSLINLQDPPTLCSSEYPFSSNIEIGFTHILQDCSGYSISSGICFGIIHAKSLVTFIVPSNKPLIRFSPALVRCPNLLINFLASSTLLHTALSFPNCKTNFFILNPLDRDAIGLSLLVDFNLAIEVAIFSNCEW